MAGNGWLMAEQVKPKPRAERAENTMTMPRRPHAPSCAVYCMDNRREDVHHKCWCRHGALTYKQFGKLHPRWRSLPPENWLRTTDGRAWHATMLGTP